jgi:hypothetical protein
MATTCTTRCSAEINRISHMRISRLCMILILTVIFPNSVNRLVFVARHCAFYLRYGRTCKELCSWTSGLKGLISLEKKIAQLLRRSHLTNKYHEELRTLNFLLPNVAVQCSVWRALTIMCRYWMSNSGTVLILSCAKLVGIVFVVRVWNQTDPRERMHFFGTLTLKP